MKRTSLYETHVALGARMVPFAGWEMPVNYRQGAAAEVKGCRATAGIFDVSHMGEVRITGRDSLAYVQHVTTNDASRLIAGGAQYSLLLNPQGGTKDDIIVYRQDGDVFLLVVNAGCKEKDWEWLNENAAGFNVSLTDESDNTALIAVQGPEAVALTQSLTDVRVEELRRFTFAKGNVCEIACVISRTGYTGEDGFELFCDWGAAPFLWNALMNAGALPNGLGARDVLRLEAAYPLYGHELDEETSPLASGLSWAIKTSKPNFIGREEIVNQTKDGSTQKLVGLVMSGAEVTIPRQGYSVLVKEDIVGTVTSGTLSPVIGAGIAMARVRRDLTQLGLDMYVDIRGKMAPAKVTAFPFYRNGV